MFFHEIYQLLDTNSGTDDKSIAFVVFFYFIKTWNKHHQHCSMSYNIALWPNWLSRWHCTYYFKAIWWEILMEKVEHFAEATRVDTNASEAYETLPKAQVNVPLRTIFNFNISQILQDAINAVSIRANTICKAHNAEGVWFRWLPNITLLYYHTYYKRERAVKYREINIGIS